MQEEDMVLVETFGLDLVTVVTPHIPPRKRELTRAIASIARQTFPARGIIVTTDSYRDGSAITRNRGLHLLDTNWVAFLDDDDEMLPDHLETLVIAAAREIKEHGKIGVVYSGCLVVDEWGQEIECLPEWGRFGQPFDPGMLREHSYLPVTSLVRSDLAQKALFGPPVGVDTDYDDWGFYLRLLDQGATFLHVPKKTWIWHHHGSNTSGRPDKW